MRLYLDSEQKNYLKEHSSTPSSHSHETKKKVKDKAKEKSLMSTIFLFFFDLISVITYIFIGLIVAMFVHHQIFFIAVHNGIIGLILNIVISGLIIIGYICIGCIYSLWRNSK